MLTTSANRDLLRELAPLTVSCSHPEAARYVKLRQGNCGYCFPCLIRRASMATAGWDTADDYTWNALDHSALLDPRLGRRGADLRAVVAGTHPGRPDRDILLNGPLPAGQGNAYLEVWRRGSDEIQAWLRAGARGDLADQLRAAP